MSTLTKLAAKLDTKITRVEFKKRVPCFHCSKSLQYFPKDGVYIGFVLESNDISRVLHRACIRDFMSGVDPY